MTITMSLEIAASISMQEIGSVLSEVGAEVCIDDDDLSGNLGASNTYFVFRKCHELEQVVTEGVSVSWAVGVRGHSIVRWTLLRKDRATLSVF